MYIQSCMHIYILLKLFFSKLFSIINFIILTILKWLHWHLSIELILKKMCYKRHMLFSTVTNLPIAVLIIRVIYSSWIIFNVLPNLQFPIVLLCICTTVVELRYQPLLRLCKLLFNLANRERKIIPFLIAIPK